MRKSFKIRAEIAGDHITLTGLRPAVRGRYIQNGRLRTTKAELRDSLESIEGATSLGLKVKQPK